MLPFAARAINAILKPYSRMLLGSMGIHDALHTILGAWVATEDLKSPRPPRDQQALAALVLTVVQGINDNPSLLNVFYCTPTVGRSGTWHDLR